MSDHDGRDGELRIELMSVDHVGFEFECQVAHRPSRLTIPDAPHRHPRRRDAPDRISVLSRDRGGDEAALTLDVPSVLRREKRNLVPAVAKFGSEMEAVGIGPASDSGEA